MKRLRKEIDKQVLKELLLIEDDYGLRPLEFAMHASCVQLFHAIVNTPGVYLVTRERKGLLETSWYDFNDYENQNVCNRRRSDKSPIKLLSFLDRQALKSPKSVRLLRNGMINDWASAKTKCNVIFIIIWCILRMLLVVSFYAIISLHMNYFVQVLYILLAGYVAQLAEQMSTPQQPNVTLNFNTTTHDDVTTTPETNLTFPSNILRAKTCGDQSFNGWYYDIEEAFDLTGGNRIQFIIIIGFCIYLFLYILFSLIFDTISMFNLSIITLVNKRKSWSNFLGKSKDRVVASMFYQMCQHFFTLWSLMYLTHSFF